jgi:hypothetical protein
VSEVSEVSATYCVVNQGENDMTEISIRHESTPEEKIKTGKLLDALKAMIQTADPEKRGALTETVVLFADWPLSRTPALLNEIMLVIGAHPDTKWP